MCVCVSKREGEKERKSNVVRECESFLCVVCAKVYLCLTNLSQRCPQSWNEVSKPSEEKHSNTEDTSEDKCDHHND